MFNVQKVNKLIYIHVRLMICYASVCIWCCYRGVIQFKL